MRFPEISTWSSELLATSTPAAERWDCDVLEFALVRAGRWQFRFDVHDDAGYLLFPLGGAVVFESRDHAVRLVDGEFSVLWTTGLSTATVRADREVMIMRLTSPALAHHRDAVHRASGSVLSVGAGTAGIVGYLLAALATGRTRPLTESPSRLAQHVIGLVGLMCIDAAGTGSGPRARLVQEAQADIEAHLGDLDLSPDQIAARLNVSTRTLHRHFEAEGLTVGGWMRERRLEHCRLELTDPVHSDSSVSLIGARWGLCDAAHFSRLFKAVYGMGPRAYRRAYSTSDTVGVRIPA